MGRYNKQGLYNGYKKNNKEREKNDYYATDPAEVSNILETLGYDFSDKTILEPCVGGGHMAKGIDKYLACRDQMSIKRIGTDIEDRGFKSDAWELTYGLDFLDDDYPVEKADVIIMNPPYATLEPFLIRALEIAQDKLIVLCRTQVLEGESRYENIFAENPPMDIYQYVDRVQCWKNGEKPSGSSAQAYCWLVWDKKNTDECPWPYLHWLRRSDKKGGSKA